jgi:hypothetical protein
VGKTIIPLAPLCIIHQTRTTGWWLWKKSHVNKYYLLQNVWYDMNTDEAASPDVQRSLFKTHDAFNDVSVALGLGKFEK